MKPHIVRPPVLSGRILFLSLALGFPALSPIAALGQTPFFGASKPISGDADIWTAGSQTWALYGGASGATTVNGITFSAANPSAGGQANKTAYWGGASTVANNLVTFATNTGSLTAIAGNTSGGGTGSAYQNLTPAYRTLLGTSTIGGNTADMTLRGLTSGRAYVVQAWANRSETAATDNTRWMADGYINQEQTAINLGLHTALKVNVPATVGGTGEFFISTFTATGITQEFDVACSNAALLTAIQVRDVTGYWSGQTNGNWSSTAANFMGGMAFNNPQITSGGFAAFTDLGLITGPEVYSGGGGSGSRTVVLSRDITVQAAGVAIPQVRFENHTDTYTFTNASGITGITGTTQLVHDGTGRVILNSANTYSGGTAVNSGTLVVNNTIGSGTGTGTLTVAEGARLEGTGIIGSFTTVSGTHAPGNGGPGTETFTSGLSYDSTSIFEWELTSSTTAGRGTNWDAVNLTTAGTLNVNPGAVFQILLSGAVDFNSQFWSSNQTWSVFEASSGATISSTFQNFEVLGGVNYNPSLGSFSMTPSGTLVWAAIPEPSTVLAGLLLVAGLMRRRRN